MRLPKMVTAAAVAALALSSAACSSSSNEPAKAPGSAALQGQTLTVAAIWSKTEQQNFEAVLTEFEKRTGATVQYESLGDELPTVIKTRVAGGQAPNVAMIAQPGLIAEFARAGNLKPLAANVESIITDQFSAGAKSIGQVDGKTYGVLFKAANKSSVWYKTADVATTPKSWDEFISELKKQSDSGKTPLSVAGEPGWALTDWFENIYLQTAGPEMYDKLAKHEIPWTDPSVTKAFEELAKVFGQSSFFPGGNAGAVATDFPTSVTNVFGTSPKASLTFEGDFVSAEITKAGAFTVGDTAKYFAFPQLAGKSAVVTGGDIAVAFKDDAATTALMEFLASSDAASVWAKAGGLLSLNKKVANDVYPDATTRQLAKELVDAGDNVRYDLSDLTPSAFGGTKGAGFWKAMQDFLANPANVAAVQQSLETSAAAAYKK